MAIFQGVDKKLIYKKQTGLGVSGSNTPQLLRRTTSTLNLAKETYQSNEIRTDQQISDMRHGARQVNGTIGGELSCKTYGDFFASVLRGEWAAVALTSATGLSLTVAAGTVTGTHTITGTGLYAKGFRLGQVAHITTASPTTNNSIRFVIVGASDTVLTVKPISSVPLVNGAFTTATVAIIGKSVSVSETGHKNDYYTVEHVFATATPATKSELFTDVKPTNAQVKVPSNGMATVDFPMIGLNMATGDSQVLTSPTTNTTTGIESGVNGVISAGGVPLAIITSIDFDINGNNAAADGVVGSVLRPDVFNGSITATGTITAHFDDAANGALALRDAFINETPITITVVLSEANSTTGANDFIAFTLPRVKLSGADVDDTQTGLKRTFPFTALKNETDLSATSMLAKTTVIIQDSQL